MLFLALLGAVQVDAGWLVLAGFCAALGTAMWKFFPWAVKRGLEDVIEEQVRPMVGEVGTRVEAVNARIDSHMDSEEENFSSMVADMAAMRTQLAERSVLFDKLQISLDERSQLFGNLHDTMERTQDVLSKHMAQDEQQFADSSTALTLGQQTLIDRLTAIEENTKKTKKRRSGE